MKTRTGSSTRTVPQAFTAAPSAALQRTCDCGQHSTGGGECEDCKKKQALLRRHSAGPTAQMTVPPIVHQVMASGGRPLGRDVQGFMEPRFGLDFSGVQVHTDARASESARAVNAFAYTVGDHIAFQTGHYNPDSNQGRRLLAHELTHVAQNRNGGTRLHASSKQVSDPIDASEREATIVSERIMAGATAHVGQESDAFVHRSVGDVLGGIGIGALAAGGAAGLGLGIAALAGAFRKCPKSHTISDDVYKAIGEAWSQSGHGGETRTEHGGRMVTDRSGKNVIRTGTGVGGTINLPAEEPGDVTQGTFHTHPYTRAQGAPLGVSFSGDDISNFIAGGQGSVKYVGAGSCIFGLTTQDQAKRDACKQKDIKQLWNQSYSSGSGSFQEKVDAAVKASIDGCGICYYKACRPNETSPIPKTASLA